ncbi:MAG: prepilin-type N-terminal cleavage/methylation domain-containing protein [Deltaproteobacteria bacterium]
MKSVTERTSRGFTLIEVIIAIVVLAILCAMMVSIFGTSFYSSSSSVFNLKKSHELNTVMEKISAKYIETPRWRKSTTHASGTFILSTAAASNQGMFRSGGGTSGTTEPSWNNISAGATTTDGSITWTYVGPSPELTALQTAIGTEGQDYGTLPDCLNGFGCYHVINNRFITFSGSKVEEACDSAATCLKYGQYLKVTIGFRSDDPGKTGETLTALFVRR